MVKWIDGRFPMGEPRGSDMDKRKKVFAVAVAGIGLLAVALIVGGIVGYALHRPKRSGIEE
jgi:hypothetical protein